MRCGERLRSHVRRAMGSANTLMQSRLEAAESAAYHCQCRALRLRPWQAPPCGCFSDEVGLGYGHSRAEVLLRRRMLAANISLFEPDPHAALAAKAVGAADTPAA